MVAGKEDVVMHKCVFGREVVALQVCEEGEPSVGACGESKMVLEQPVGIKKDLGWGSAASDVANGVCRHPMAVDLGLRSLSFSYLDTATKEWVLWCAIGKLRVNVDVSLLQFQIDLIGFRARVSGAGEAFSSLEFLDNEAREAFLKHNTELLEPLLDWLVAWEMSDLAVANYR